jgi:hypothetical protein
MCINHLQRLTPSLAVLETTTRYRAYGAPQQAQFLQIQSPYGITTSQNLNLFGDGEFL